MTPHFEELPGIPTPCSNTSSASVLVVGTDAFVAYERGDQADEPVTLLRFSGCRRVVTGGPNDEAIGNHRFYKFGLRFYSIQLLIDSPWIDEILKELHKDRTPAANIELQHFVLTLKEDTVDVLATTIKLAGTYSSHKTAMKAAVGLCQDGVRDGDWDRGLGATVEKKPPVRTDPWPWIDRLPNGWLELSFDAPLDRDDRVDWLKVRDWLITEYNAEFSRRLVDPITSSWLVEFDAHGRGKKVSGMLYCQDFPDDLILRVVDRESEELIHDAAARLQSTKPDLGSLANMNKEAFWEWIGPLKFD